MQLFICILFKLIQLFIHVFFDFVDDSYNHSFEFFEVSSSSLLLKYIIVELLAFRGVMLPFFSCVSTLGFTHPGPSYYLEALIFHIISVEVFAVFMRD
jgi:hypothetical protein